MKIVSFIRTWSSLLNEKLSALIEGSINQSQLLDEKLSALIEGSINQSQLLNAKLSALIEGSINQSQLLNAKLDKVDAGLANQSSLLNEKLSALIEGSINQSQLLNEKLSVLIDGSINQSQLPSEKLPALIEGSINQSQLLNAKLDRIDAGLENQSSLLNEKLSALIEGSINQSQLLNEKLSVLIDGSINQSQLLNEKLSVLIDGSINQSQLPSEKLSALIEGSINQSQLLNAKLDSVDVGLANQSSLLNEKLSALIEGSINQSQLLNEKLSVLIEESNTQSILSEKLEALIEGSINQSQLPTEKLSALIEGSNNQSILLSEKLSALIEGSINQSQLFDEKLSALIEGANNQSQLLDSKFNTLEGVLVNQSTALNEQLATVRILAELGRTQIATQTEQTHVMRTILELRAQQTLLATEDSKTNGRIVAHDDSAGAIDTTPRHAFTGIRNTLRHSTIYICYADHEHDRTYTENIIEYLESNGVPCKTVELSSSGRNGDLQQILEDQPAAIIGYNSQLDHAWLPSGSFMEAAAARHIPVIQWILDHPSSRWAEFRASTRTNSRFLFNSRYAEQYFHRYCLPGAFTETMGGVGPNRRSRIERLSLESFLRRPVSCLVALSLTRLRRVEDLREEVESIDADLVKAVNEAVARARFDLVQPLEVHLAEILERTHPRISNEAFNLCFHWLEASVQTLRRMRIFEIARNYPVLLQSDETATPVIAGGKATWELNVGMQQTAARMPACRAILSVSPLNDTIHDRTMNGVNAGCVSIVEDSPAHRNVFQHERNALLFRYDDDSLSRCLDVVCNKPLQAYEIAKAGFELRRDPRLGFGDFGNLLKLAVQQGPLHGRQPPATSRQHGILVLGMHRSGTSALTRVLNILGARLPSHLAQPTIWNERGFWESVLITNIHDEILKAVSSKWDDSSALQLEIDSPIVRPFRNRMKELLHKEFEGISVFVVKDPRICRFVPLWLSLFEEMGVLPHAALIVRNPLEVARSLNKRDGLAPAHSYSLWLRHVLDAERATRDVSRGIILYEDMLSGWHLAIKKLIDDLNLPWMAPARESFALINAFLSSSLRHYSNDPRDLRASPETCGPLHQAFTALCELAKADVAETRSTLDAVTEEFNSGQDDLGQSERPVVELQLWRK